MPCFYPKPSVIVPGATASGKSVVLFRPKSVDSVPSGSKLVPIPCGQCIGCRLERSRQWAIRLMKELHLHERASFLTLTYTDLSVPKLRNGRMTLVLEDVQLFLKRLRKWHLNTFLSSKGMSEDDWFAIPKDERLGLYSGLRYFQCGEYGCDDPKNCRTPGCKHTARPHHHMILFGEDFIFDRFRIRDSRSGFPQWESPTLNSLWSKGDATISDVVFESAAYVARYCLKKHTGKGAKFFYKGRKPEFVTMSRRPGIGAGFFDEYKDEIYPLDEVATGVGRPNSLPPKAFDRLLEKVDPVLFESVKKKRVETLDFWSDPNSTDTRLATRERVKQSIIKNTLKRGF